jgi:hypothetical protein
MDKFLKLRNIVKSQVIKEYEETRLDKQLINVTMRLVMNTDTHVPDTLTRIRILPTVSVVGQSNPVNRDKPGVAIVDVYIKFMPNSSETYKNLKGIAKLCKSLPGIKIVKILTLGGRSVLYKGKPIVV